MCKDIAKRLARRERQVNEVMDLLADAITDPQPTRRELAESIVVKLSQLGVSDD